MKRLIMAFLTLVASTGVPCALAQGTEDAAWQKVVDAAKKEGSVNFSTTTFVGTSGVAVSKAFKDRYGITLELIGGRSSVRVEKVQMEQKSKSYATDVFDGSPSHLATLKKDAYLESIADGLPALREKDKFVRSPAEDSQDLRRAQILAVLLNSRTLWYNTNLVKPGEEPKSYYDLLDAKWKGKLYLNNPLYGSTPDSHMTVFAKAKVLPEDFFVKLYKNATLSGTGGAKEIVDKLTRGEFAIGGPIGANDPMPNFLAGAPIKPLDLKEGSVAVSITLAALKSPPHPNATRVLVNWLLSRDGQAVISKAVGVEGIRNDIPPALPFAFKAPVLYETYELMLFSEERYAKQYLANLLDIKR